MPELFYSSNLEMSLTPLSRAAAGLSWGDVLSNRIAVVAVLVLLILELQDIVRVFPALLRCVPLWKGNMELEHSVSQARTRNTVSFVMWLLFCIVADRYALCNPSFMALVPQGWKLAVTAALIGGAVLLRRLFYLVSPLRSKTNEFACTVRHTLYNYFILYVALALLICVLLGAARVPDNTIRVSLYVAAGAVYFLHLLRTGQILRSRYGLFATFLYLCALEILPLGILIFACTR